MNSPGLTYRRSAVAAAFGVLFLGVAFSIACLANVPKGDLFAGFMAGAGAIGALMAAYEAADAAASANQIAERANSEQLVPLLGAIYKGDGDFAQIVLVNDGPRSVFIEKVELGAMLGDQYHSVVVTSVFGQDLPIRLEGFASIKSQIPFENAKGMVLCLIKGDLKWHIKVTTATTRTFESNRYTVTARESDTEQSPNVLV